MRWACLEFLHCSSLQIDGRPRVPLEDGSRASVHNWNRCILGNQTTGFKVSLADRFHLGVASMITKFGANSGGSV
jgi:hypothetical protein